MSKFAMGFVQAGAPQNGTPRHPRRKVKTRVNANVRRQFSYLGGYFVVVGFLALIAALSMSAALWRLSHFAR